MASPANSTLPLPSLPLPREPTTAHAYILPIISLLAIFILLVPFIFHLRARNTGACALIGYLCLFNLMVFVNVLIWPDNNFADWWDGAVLCDVEVKIFWPVTVGIAASTMAITRSLAIVLDVENTELNPSRARRRRRILVDLVICFGVPVLIAGLHVLVHTHRYVIVSIGGCTDTYFGSWVTVFVIFIWPLFFTLINVYYAALVITRLHRHRSSISTILSSHSLNTSRFLRLFIMSLLLLLIYLPLNIYWFYINVSQPLSPYSWSAVHPPDRGSIPYLPAIGVFTFDRYVPVAMALFVFSFFGAGTEARRIYAAMGVAMGMGRCFPRLLRERRPSTDGGLGKRGWLDKLSLVSLGKRYIAKFSSRGSQAATEMTSQTNPPSPSSRKPSATAIENASFTFQTSSPSTTRPASLSLSPSATPPAPPPPQSFLARLRASLRIARSGDAGAAEGRMGGMEGRGGRGGMERGRRDGMERGMGRERRMGIDDEDDDLVHQGSRTRVWSPRAPSRSPPPRSPLPLSRGQVEEGVGRFERLGSVGSEGTEGTEGVGEGEVKVRTRVGVRVERV